MPPMSPFHALHTSSYFVSLCNKGFMCILAFTEVYLEPRRTSTMKFFCENSQRLLAKKVNRRCLTGF